MRLLRSASAVAVLGALALVTWLPRPTTAAPAPAAPNDVIEEAMGTLQRSLRTLGKGISEETHDQSLSELLKVEAALMQAKTQVPDTAADVDEKKRSEFVAEFRVLLIETLQQVLDAEAAVVSGDHKKAEGIVRKLGQMKSKGHDKFKGE